MMPAFVGGVMRISGKNVEPETRAAAVRGRAHPETLEPARVADHPLEPHLIAGERPTAVHAPALARLLRRAHRVVVGCSVVVGVGGHGAIIIPTGARNARTK